MALPTTRMLSVRYVMKHGSNVIGGGKSATLIRERELVDAYFLGASTNDDAHVRGVTSWRLEASGLYMEAAPVFGCSAGLTVNGEAVGGALQLAELHDATVTIAIGSTETGDITDSCAREYAPTIRTTSVDFNGLFLDPLNAAGVALDDLGTNIGTSATADVAFVVSWGSASLTFSGNCSNLTIGGADAKEHFPISGSFTANGAVTDVWTDANAGISGLLTDCFDDPPSTETYYLENTRDGAGSTRWQGTAFPTNVTISVRRGQPVEFSFTAQGTGVLTEETVT